MQSRLLVISKTNMLYGSIEYLITSTCLCKKTFYHTKTVLSIWKPYGQDIKKRGLSNRVSNIAACGRIYIYRGWVAKNAMRRHALSDCTICASWLCFLLYATVYQELWHAHVLYASYDIAEWLCPVRYRYAQDVLSYRVERSKFTVNLAKDPSPNLINLIIAHAQSNVNTEGIRESRTL